MNFPLPFSPTTTPFFGLKTPITFLFIVRFSFCKEVFLCKMLGFAQNLSKLLFEDNFWVSFRVFLGLLGSFRVSFWVFSGLLCINKCVFSGLFGSSRVFLGLFWSSRVFSGLLGSFSAFSGLLGSFRAFSV